MRQEQREKDQANLLDFALALISFPSVYTFALSFTLSPRTVVIVVEYRDIGVRLEVIVDSPRWHC